MKKTIMLMAAAGIMLTVQPAIAGPVNISGDATIKYQKDTMAGEDAVSGSVYSLKVMAEAELGEGWSLYTRFGAQHVTKTSQADFTVTEPGVPNAYGENTKTVATLDQFGINYKTDKLSYKLGRQNLTVGTTALLYNRPDTNVGKWGFVDGLTVAGTVGVVDISAVAAREDNPNENPKNKIYAVRAGFNPTENFNYGVTLARYNGDASTKHWAVDGTYKFGKSSLTAEYTKASSSERNKAYAIVLGHDFDDRLSASITGFRVEEFGSIGQQSDFAFNNRGVHYQLNYKMNDDASLEFVYKDRKTIDTNLKNTSFEASINYSF